MAWQTLFRLVGPLDWQREDWRDARQHTYEYCKEGTKFKDSLLFKPLQREKTEVEEEIESLEQMIAEIVKIDHDPEAIGALRAEIARLRVLKIFTSDSVHAQHQH
ncbi:MAG: hypothetical protein ACOX6D_02565 [Thermoguttaceae bacterium]|jgi:hypothetical protein